MARGDWVSWPAGPRRLILAAGLGLLLTGPATAEQGCDPDDLAQAIQACGMDIACMNQASADFNARCQGPQPSEPLPMPAPQPAAEADDLQQRLEACGVDIGCMNRIMQEAQGGGSTPPQPPPSPGPPAPPTPPGPPSPPQPGATPPGGQFGGQGEMIQRMQSCGNDSSCYEQVMQEMMQQPGGPEGQPSPPPPLPSPGPSGPGGSGPGDLAGDDTTQRLGESTVLPASWLQTYQNTLVGCGGDGGCWGREITAANNHVISYCGPNLLHEPTMVCRIAASYEVQIEAAIAQQRLWRKGVRVQEGPTATPGSQGEGQQGESPSPSLSPPGDTADATDPGDAGEATETLDFVPKVSKGRVLFILERWEQNLGSLIPQEGRDKITAAAEAYPLDGEAEPAPLVFEEVETPQGTTIDTRPTRRDWAYAMIGGLLTHAALVEGGDRGKTLLDVAFWCFVRAARLHLEADHLSNVGFHLNLKGSLEEARDVLIYAGNQAPSQPDVHNNLAFSLSAMGEQENAERVQEMALKADPANGHIRSRYDGMTPGDLPDRPSEDMVPPGWDFGEAYFRLGKRHTLREYWAGKEWHEAEEKAKSSVSGGYPDVSGPHEWYQERLKDIADSHSNCVDRAPKELVGCPFGDYVYHPSCKNAPSRAEVDRSIHNRRAALCRCAQTSLNHQVDALNAYIDNAQAVWREHEKKWLPPLRRYVREWSSDIQTVNARYPADVFQFPVETGYTEWIKEFREDSEDFWGNDLPGAAERWHDLKSQAQSQEACKIPLPPLRPVPKKPKEEPEKVQAYGINLGVVEWEVRMDLSFKFKFDLGFIKGGYERMAGDQGSKWEVGSGPVEISYTDLNKPPGAGGDDYKLTMSFTLNFLNMAPGPVKPLATAADRMIKFGGKYEVGWGNQSGFNGQAKLDQGSKFGIVNTQRTVPRPVRLQN